jgi:hypothetical protein
MLVGIAVVSLAAPATSQEQAKTEVPKTRLEAFLATKGSLVVKDFYAIGSMRGLELEAVALLEPGKESQKVRGLRAEITEYGRVSNTHSSFLDMDELAGLVQAVDYMDKLLNEWRGQKREAYTEVVFATKGDFRLGFYQKGDEQKIFVSSGLIGKADFYAEPKDLPRLREMLMQASEKLKAL